METNEIDVFLSRTAVSAAVGLSFPTISRMQRLDRFPRFEPISSGRRGLRKSVLAEFLAGRRDWSDFNDHVEAQIAVAQSE